MSSEGAPAVPSPPFSLTLTTFEHSLEDPEGFVRLLFQILSGRDDTVVYQNNMYKLTVFVFGEDYVAGTFVVRVYHVDGEKHIIEVQRRNGDHLERTLLQIILTILEGGDHTTITFRNLLKPRMFPTPDLNPEHVSPLPEDKHLQIFSNLTQHLLDSPYADDAENLTRTIVTMVNDRVPQDTLKALCEELRTAASTVLAKIYILQMFINYPALWEKLNDEDTESVKQFVARCIESTPEEKKQLQDMMLKKVALRFRESLLTSTSV